MNNLLLIYQNCPVKRNQLITKNPTITIKDIRIHVVKTNGYITTYKGLFLNRTEDCIIIRK
jgi:hypothetical protein